jgi:putative membrane protein
MKTILNKIFLTAGIAVAAVCAAQADGDMNNLGSTNYPMLSAQQFVWDAALAGRKEIRFSEIALDESQDADIKKFAKRMVTDHSKANAGLIKIADEEGLAYPETNTFSMDDTNWNTASTPSSYTIAVQNIKQGQLLMATNMQDAVDYQSIRYLQSLSGEQFDQAYLNDMVADHAKAVDLFASASSNLDDAKLKKFAGKTLPTLRKHYMMVQDLAGKHGGDTMQNNNWQNPTNNPPRTGTGL